VVTGSNNDFLLNIFVPRVSAAPQALAATRTLYATTGILQRPLVTLHTLRDQQVPYWHEVLYDLKTLASGSLFTRHLNIPIDRFEHYNFTPDELLSAFAVMCSTTTCCRASPAPELCRHRHSRVRSRPRCPRSPCRRRAPAAGCDSTCGDERLANSKPARRARIRSLFVCMSSLLNSRFGAENRCGKVSAPPGPRRCCG